MAQSLAENGVPKVTSSKITTEEYLSIIEENKKELSKNFHKFSDEEIESFKNIKWVPITIPSEFRGRMVKSTYPLETKDEGSVYAEQVYLKYLHK